MNNKNYVAMRDDFLMHSGRDLLTKQAWKRVNHCQAWFCKRDGYWWLKSYSTIVAVYDEDLDMLISFGRYSATTYQHVRKFRNNYLPHGWDTTEMNLMVDDCWGCYSGFRW